MDDTGELAVTFHSRCPQEAVDALGLNGHRYVRGELDRMHLEHEKSGGSVQYLVARRGRQVAGFVPAYWDGRPSPDLAELVPRLAGRLVVLGTQGTFENFWRLTGRLSCDQQREIVTAMVNAVTASPADGTDQEPAAAAVPYLSSDQLAWFQGAPLRTLAVRQKAILPVRWSSFEEYVTWLPHARRPDIRRERRRFDQSGLVVAEEDLLVCAAEVAPLICATEARYGHVVTAEELTGYLLMTRLSFDEDVVALVARREGRAVAVSTLLKDGPVWHVRSWGCDYAATTDRDCAYFNLVYYEPLVRAMGRGHVTLDFSVGSLRSKTLRGACVESLHSLWTQGRSLVPATAGS